MFRKKPEIHNHNYSGQHISQKTEIVEQRAPTDESVQLLSEMERAAEKKFLHAFYIELDRNALSGVVLQMDKSPVDVKTHWNCLFNLNGQAIRAEGIIDHDQFDPEKIFLQELTKEVSARIYAQFQAIKTTERMKGTW